MSIRTVATQAVLEKIFGKTYEEQEKGVLATTISRYARSSYNLKTDHPFGIHVRTEGNGSSTVSVGFRGISSLLNFTLSKYPACCGSRLFHHFHLADKMFTDDQLAEILNTFFHENVWDEGRTVYGTSTRIDGTSGWLGRGARIEVIMVEYGRDLPYVHVGGERMVDILAEVEPVENPTIQYKQLWNYFHKNAKRVRTRLEVNPNSSNVLHNMEVIIN